MFEAYIEVYQGVEPERTQTIEIESGDTFDDVTERIYNAWPNCCPVHVKRVYLVLDDNDEYALPCDNIFMRPLNEASAAITTAAEFLETAELLQEHDERAYINFCYWSGDVMCKREFQDKKGGIVPPPAEYAEEYLSNCFDVPESIRPYVGFQRLGEDIYMELEMTEEDNHTGEQWFIN